MPDKLKLPAIIALVVAAVVLVIISGYKAFQSPEQTDDAKRRQYLQKVHPEQLQRLPPYQQKMITQERAKAQ